MDERVDRSTLQLYLLNDRIHERRVSDELRVTTQTRYSPEDLCSVELGDSEPADFPTFSIGQTVFDRLPDPFNTVHGWASIGSPRVMWIVVAFGSRSLVPKTIIPKDINTQPSSLRKSFFVR